MIVDRRDLRPRIAAVLTILMHQPRAEKSAESA
jgi:acetyl-CoA carboxylase beta subunit